MAARQGRVGEELAVDGAERRCQSWVAAHVFEEDHDARTQLGLESCVAEDALQHVDDRREMGGEASAQLSVQRAKHGQAGALRRPARALGHQLLQQRRRHVRDILTDGH